MNPDSHKDPRESILRLNSDHLKANDRRKLGPQKAGLVQCAKGHGFYPADESCPYCLSWLEEQSVEMTPGERYFMAHQMAPYLPSYLRGAPWGALSVEWQTYFEGLAAKVASAASTP